MKKGTIILKIISLVLLLSIIISLCVLCVIGYKKEEEKEFQMDSETITLTAPQYIPWHGEVRVDDLESPYQELYEEKIYGRFENPLTKISSYDSYVMGFSSNATTFDITQYLKGGRVDGIHYPQIPYMEKMTDDEMKMRPIQDTIAHVVLNEGHTKVGEGEVILSVWQYLRLYYTQKGGVDCHKEVVERVLTEGKKGYLSVDAATQPLDWYRQLLAMLYYDMILWDAQEDFPIVLTDEYGTTKEYQVVGHFTCSAYGKPIPDLDLTITRSRQYEEWRFMASMGINKIYYGA